MVWGLCLHAVIAQVTYPLELDTDGDGALDGAEAYAIDSEAALNPNTYPLDDGLNPTMNRCPEHGIDVLMSIGPTVLIPVNPTPTNPGDEVNDPDASGFKPIVVTIVNGFPLGHKIEVSYNPAKIRLWTRDAGEPRRHADIDNTDRGSVVPPGVDLMWNQGFQEKMDAQFYIEGVAPGTDTLTFEVVERYCDPAGAPGWGCGQDPIWTDYICVLDGGSKERSVEITIIKVDLDIWNGGADLDNGEAAGSQGSQVPEADEESVGAFLQVNWDDDDADGSSGAPVPDLTESGTVSSEDNLAQLKPSLDPMLDEGTVELEVSGTDAGKVKLWTASTKGTEVTLTSNKKTWDLSNATQKTDFQNVMANSLWIEGIDPGTAKRAVTFTLHYKDGGGTEICNDVNKATVVFMRLGSGVYRELAISAWKDLGHGGIFYRFKNGVELTEANLADDANYEVCHSMGDANGPTIQDYTNISDHPTASHWVGCYETANLSYVNRLNALKGAKALYDLRASIDYPPGVADDVLVTTSGGVDTWNGAFSDIEELRCDGFVEVIYEKPGTYIGHVWGKLVSGVWGYAISIYATQHNDQDYTWGYSNNFNPGTQSGYTTPTGNTQTQFQWKQWVVEPAILN